ncbi:MAG TPA: site-2 protease family protein [Pseudogracilibacillus sp.]|nr:site-2 protease family protein [Pseudogracilibacillus sp.]
MTFLKKLHIHPLFLLLIVLSLFTGTFVQLFILFAIILIHEIGHYTLANHYQWHIQSIVLWVFGGVMKTTEATNRPIKEDIIVTVAGPLQHIWMFAVIYGCSYIDIIPTSLVQTAFYFNWLLLLFNLLPIYPLDGGKLLFYILSLFLPYKKAHQYTYRFSLLACILLVLFLFFNPFTLTAVLLLLFLMWENYQQWRQHPYIFMRFLLQRMKMPEIEILFVDHSYTLMDVFSLFKRTREHEIKLKESTYSLSETEALDYYFNKGKIQESVGQIIKVI